MRDIFKDCGYFDNYIKKLMETIAIQTTLLQSSSIAFERHSIAQKGQSESYLKLIKAKYSRGDDMDTPEVLEIYSSIIDNMQKFWPHHFYVIKYPKKGEVVYLKQYGFSGYLHIMDMLSLGVLFNVPENDFKTLVDFIDKDEVKDYLLEFLIHFRVENRASINEESYNDDKFRHINNRLKLLKSLIDEDDKVAAQNKLKHFLEKKWYKSLKDTGYYNQHNSKFDTYSGYWCLVAAAIVKIKDLDDGDFRDNPYYPKDLV